MPTPSSGSISMLDFRNEITRGTGAISMSSIRNYYGGSSISFGDLYNTEGFQITVGSRSAGKFGSVYGYDRGVFTIGSVSPSESNTLVQFAASSFLRSLTTGTSVTTIQLDNNNDPTTDPTGGSMSAGFTGNDITRICVNGEFAIPSSNTEFSASAPFGEIAVPPSNGTIVSCLVKF